MVVTGGFVWADTRPFGRMVGVGLAEGTVGAVGLAETAALPEPEAAPDPAAPKAPPAAAPPLAAAYPFTSSPEKTTAANNIVLLFINPRVF